MMGGLIAKIAPQTALRAAGVLMSGGNSGLE